METSSPSNETIAMVHFSLLQGARSVNDSPRAEQPAYLANRVSELLTVLHGREPCVDAPDNARCGIVPTFDVAVADQRVEPVIGHAHRGCNVSRPVRLPRGV